MNDVLRPALALWRREIVRFFRQKGRVIGVFGTALIFWGVLGFGLGSSFRDPSAATPLAVRYEDYFFPGIVAMILLFTAIFASFSLIEDRNEGFLQGVLVAPVSPAATVLGKLLGGTTIAMLQGVLFLALAPLVRIPLSFGAVIATCGVMAILAFGLTGLGFFAAWRSNSIQGFHGVMNLVLLPMWFLSGAIFPAEGAHPVLKGLMMVNPMTYGVAALRRTMWNEGIAESSNVPSLFVGILVTLGFAGVMFAASMAVARRATAGDLK